jgi:formylglycine-generating enzyme required for sulfatase activity
VKYIVLLVVFGGTLTACSNSKPAVLSETVAPPSAVSAASSPPSSVAVTTTSPAGVAGPASGRGMLRIPAGSVTLGVDDPMLGNSQTRATRRVVSPFWIDVHEVTNGEYKKFVDNYVAPPPLRWSGPRGYPLGESDRPVQGVDWNWAAAYCSSLGKALPSEVQWEVAAAGPQRLRYSWGNGDAPAETKVEGVYAVGSVKANVTSSGIADLSGGVWEWVGETYDPERVLPHQRVLRGGGNGFVRDNFTRDVAESATSGAFHAGLRCASEIVEPEADLSFRAISLPPIGSSKAADDAPNVIIRDDFTDSQKYGWRPFSDPKIGVKYGYHPVNRFHVEVTGPNHHALVLQPGQEAPEQALLHIKTQVGLDLRDMSDGLTFSYGLAFAYNGEETKGLIFVADASNGTWLIAERAEKTDGLPSDKAYRTIETGRRDFANSTLTLEVLKKRDTYEFRLNGQFLRELDRRPKDGKPGLDDLAGGTWAGLFVITYAGPSQALVHAHYSLFEMTRDA